MLKRLLTRPVGMLIRLIVTRPVLKSRVRQMLIRWPVLVLLAGRFTRQSSFQPSRRHTRLNHSGAYQSARAMRIFAQLDRARTKQKQR